MKKTEFILFLLAFVVVRLPGALRVVATYPAIAAIVTEVGGDGVEVTCLADGRFDPHFITPKPSLIVKLRRADLLVINGAQLEIGWLPPLLSQAGNPRLLPGQRGFLDLSRFVPLLDVPSSVSREQGDVHPDGNPHFLLDPQNVLLAAQAVAERLASMDPGHAASYRVGLARFSTRWRARMTLWSEKLKPLAGKRVIAYHRLYDYLLRRFGLVLDAVIEPLPGIPPSSRHLAALRERLRAGGVSFILQDVYHSAGAARFLSRQSGVPMAILPHDVGAVENAGDLFALFDEIVRRLGQ